MAKKVYDEDGLDMKNTNWDGDESTGNLPVSGRLVENYIKQIDENTTPVEEVTPGETKPPTSGAVAGALVGTVTDIEVGEARTAPSMSWVSPKRMTKEGKPKRNPFFQIHG